MSGKPKTFLPFNVLSLFIRRGAEVNGPIKECHYRSTLGTEIYRIQSRHEKRKKLFCMNKTAFDQEYQPFGTDTK